MGMSASQANLLYYTSLLHDVENSAQYLESEKLALAVQSDEVYQTYCDALDAKKIQVAFNDGAGNRYFTDATFENVCLYDPNRVQQYSLTDAKSGKLFVNAETKQVYEMFESDKYGFAWEMLGLKGSNIAIWGGSDVSVDFLNGNPFSQVEQAVILNHINGGEGQTDATLSNAYDTYMELQETLLNDDDSDDATNKELLKALGNIKELLYSKYMNEIYPLMRLDKQQSDYTVEDMIALLNKGMSVEEAIKELQKDAGTTDQLIGPDEFPSEEFKYYLRLWENIHNSGGCKEVPADAVMGNEANAWFNNMVTTGQAIINVYNDKKKEWGETTVGTSTSVNFLQENQDETDLKKAEAEYEYQLSIIEAKDTRIDKELSKLETERSSIKQVLESIKKVKDENIERTFNLFS